MTRFTCCQSSFSTIHFSNGKLWLDDGRYSIFGGPSYSWLQLLLDKLQDNRTDLYLSCPSYLLQMCTLQRLLLLINQEKGRMWWKKSTVSSSENCSPPPALWISDTINDLCWNSVASLVRTVKSTTALPSRGAFQHEIHISRGANIASAQGRNSWTCVPNTKCAAMSHP